VKIFSILLSLDINPITHTITICSELQEIFHSQFLSTVSSKLYTLTQIVSFLQPSTAVLSFYITQKEPSRNFIFL